ncbi:NUDIX hydrolase [Tomitella gaofuii]|uniref:NUDIX hydrolase n=1 Tax=Tomitella gaofuii TaxID=2760083 RepID=UPI001F433FA7|nr:NUDIX hydrolase [Tomitella gaofuii]
MSPADHSRSGRRRRRRPAQPGNGTRSGGARNGGTRGAGARNSGTRNNGARQGSGGGRRTGDGTTGRRMHTVRETSAGGLVIDGFDRTSADGSAPAGELRAALIGRLDRRGRTLWSMPKGHVEAGETVEQTATREIAEETGIRGEVLASLGSIDYWFVSDGRRIHKTVHHFLLRYQGGELSDEDYEVSEVEWVPLGELSGRLAYADERKLAAVAAEILGEMISGPAPRGDAGDEVGAPPRPQPGSEPSKRARRRRRSHRAMLPKPRGKTSPT